MASALILPLFLCVMVLCENSFQNFIGCFLGISVGITNAFWIATIIDKAGLNKG